MAALCPGSATADTITFSTGIPGVFTGPAFEGDFSYSLLSGGLFIDSSNGNPGEEIEGLIADGGGTLQVLRDDILSGLFTFDQVDLQQVNSGAVLIVFEGYLGGALQGTDSLVTSAVSLVHITVASSNLNGVSIDELRVILDASSGPFRWEGIDNVVLTSVPEPSNLVLIGLGVIPLHSLRRLRPRG